MLIIIKDAYDGRKDGPKVAEVSVDPATNQAIVHLYGVAYLLELIPDDDNASELTNA